jgi:hypothetical protein
MILNRSANCQRLPTGNTNPRHCFVIQAENRAVGPRGRSPGGLAGLGRHCLAANHCPSWHPLRSHWKQKAAQRAASYGNACYGAGPADNSLISEPQLPMEGTTSLVLGEQRLRSHGPAAEGRGTRHSNACISSWVARRK